MSRLISALIIIVGYSFLIYEIWSIWHEPALVSHSVILSIAVLMAFEFILVHSGVFMSFFTERKAWLFFAVFYGLFAFAFNAAMPNNILLYVYAMVVFTRMSVLLFDPSEEQVWQARKSSMVAVVLYMLSIMAVVIDDNLIPDFGLTQRYLAESGYLASLNVKGIFPEIPKTAFAASLIYYCGLIIWELYSTHRWFKKKEDPQPPLRFY